MISETLINFIKISYTIMDFESSFLFNQKLIFVLMTQISSLTRSSSHFFPLTLGSQDPQALAFNWPLYLLPDHFSGCLSSLPSSLKVFFWTFTLSSLLIIYKPGHLLIEKGLGQTSSVEKSLWILNCNNDIPERNTENIKGWVGYEGRLNWKENRFSLVSKKKKKFIPYPNLMQQK